MTTPSWPELQEDLDDTLSDLAGYSRYLPEIWVPSHVQGLRNMIDAITKTLTPIAVIVEGEFGACTCDKDDDSTGPCPCTACAKAAETTHACERRTPADRQAGLYDGMCDGCFEAARDIAPCGLRVAEHRHGLADETSS